MTETLKERCPGYPYVAASSHNAQRKSTMATHTETASSFHQQLVEALPGLRIHALALSRQRVNADDLVHDVVCRALAAQASFQADSNFSAWIHRIMRNRFITVLRRRRDTVNIGDVPETLLASEPAQEHRMALQELARAVDRLPPEQRQALTMIVVREVSYEELARTTNCAVGAAKSRVFRARRQLETWLVGNAEDVRGAGAPPRVRAASSSVPFPESVCAREPPSATVLGSSRRGE